MSDQEIQRQRKLNAWMLAVGVAIGLLIWFAVDNAHSVQVHFWVHSIHTPLIVVITVSALFGAGILELWRQSRKHR